MSSTISAERRCSTKEWKFCVAAIGAVMVGFLESFSSFWASAFKESIVFTLIIPVLLWRSLTAQRIEEDEEP